MPRRASSIFQDRPFLPLALLIAVIQFLMMPGEFYRGDPNAIRMSSLQLIKNGRFSVQEDKAPTLGTMTEPEGKYFFHNKASHLYFSKYGAFNTILYTPPLIAEDLLHGIENYYDYERPTANQPSPLYTRSLILMLNLYNILLSLVIAYYYFQITGFFSKSTFSRCVFVLATFYATFMWNYLRAQSTEILQVLFFAGFFFHFIRFHQTSTRRDLLISTLFAGALALTKQYYFLIFPIAVIAAWKTKPHELRPAIIRLMIAPMAAFALINLALNAWQFGSLFEAGYGQWQNAQGEPNDSFSPIHLPAALAGLLFRMDRSLLLHFPPLLISFFGIRLFARQNKFALAFAYTIFGVILLLVSNFKNWSGDWCYGPRYFLFILPMISLPFLSVLDFVLSKQTPARVAASVAILFALLVSERLQWRLNSLPFFTVYELTGHYRKFDLPGVKKYFENKNFGVISGDFSAYRKGDRPFPPLEAVRASGAEAEAEALDQLQKSGDFSANYFFKSSGE